MPICVQTPLIGVPNCSGRISRFSGIAARTRTTAAIRNETSRRTVPNCFLQQKENAPKKTAQAAKSAVSAKTFVPQNSKDRSSFKNRETSPIGKLPNMHSSSSGISLNSSFR